MKQRLKTMITLLGLSIGFVMFGAAQTAQAATYTVDTTADDAALSDCTAAANDCSLRGAIARANGTIDNDTIEFALPAGVNTITLMGVALTINNAGAFITGGELTIQNAGALTITNSTGASNLLISGNNATRVFFVNPGANLTLNAVSVIRGGYATGSDGGGGIQNKGTTTITNSAVSGNTAQGSAGGGIYNSGTMSLTNSTVSGNEATNNYYGGGICNYAGTLTLLNSTVSGNTARDGGGIYNYRGTLNLTSVTVAYNHSRFAGDAGGVNNLGGIARLRNTIVGRNTISASSSSPDFRGAIEGASFFNLIGNGIGMTGIIDSKSNSFDDRANQVGTAARPIDPNLDPTLALNGGTTPNHALLPGSRAIDWGNDTGTDQRGFDRPLDLPNYENVTGKNGVIGNGADIGAFEVQEDNAVVDADGDGISDANDNCPNTANANQANNDGDTLGDVCDSDDDNDGVSDEQDAFPFDSNESVDTDGDGIGNNADTDDDGDGQLDGDETACGSNPLLASSKAADNDADNSPDCVDSDDDNDGVLDTSDAFPFNPNESVDTDKDGMGNNADTDDDNDGQTDADEIACGSDPLSAASKSPDTDGDNRPNCVDTDDDNDGVLDTADNCPLVANPDQADFDLDGIGDTCDPQTGPPRNKEQCKNGGFMRFDFPRTFKNQGDCIQFVNTGK
jgi:hypothetical protein